jgi:hypothetical protein
MDCEFFFPEKTLEASYSFLHHEYEAECRANKKSCSSFLRHYRRYADKYRTILRIRRIPEEIMEVDWAGSTDFIIIELRRTVKSLCIRRDITVHSIFICGSKLIYVIPLNDYSSQ